MNLEVAFSNLCRSLWGIPTSHHQPARWPESSLLQMQIVPGIPLFWVFPILMQDLGVLEDFLFCLWEEKLFAFFQMFKVQNSIQAVILYRYRIIITVGNWPTSSGLGILSLQNRSSFTLHLMLFSWRIPAWHLTNLAGYAQWKARCREA